MKVYVKYLSVLSGEPGLMALMCLFAAELTVFDHPTTEDFGMVCGLLLAAFMGFMSGCSLTGKHPNLGRFRKSGHVAEKILWFASSMITGLFASTVIKFVWRLIA